MIRTVKVLLIVAMLSTMLGAQSDTPKMYHEGETIPLQVDHQPFKMIVKTGEYAPSAAIPKVVTPWVLVLEFDAQEANPGIVLEPSANPNTSAITLTVGSSQLSPVAEADSFAAEAKRRPTLVEDLGTSPKTGRAYTVFFFTGKRRQAFLFDIPPEAKDQRKIARIEVGIVGGGGIQRYLFAVELK